MKLEITDHSKDKVIATYVVPAISMLSFEEWKDLIEVVVPLDQLSVRATDLDSSDPETSEPTLVVTPVDFYLPGPLKDGVTERLTEHQVSENAASSQYTDSLRGVEERICAPPLDVSTILLAVVGEISRNHLPNEAYEVRISDE